MSNPLLDAMRSAPRRTWLDKIAYASLHAAEAKFFPRPAAPLVTVELNVEKVDAYDTARVSLALQDATAKIGHLIQDPRTSTSQSRKQYREAAPLVPRGQIGNLLYFGFPEVAPPEGALFDERVQTLSERAVLDLFEILPESTDDDRALDAVLARHVTERAAISDLVSAVKETDTGLGMKFSAGDRVIAVSTLSHDQADVLETALSESNVDRKGEIVEGVLDGMRTSRRLFYLETENGPDISGALDEDKLAEVRDYIGERVVATLERTQVLHKSGKIGRRSYRLLDLQGVDSLFD
ncbi:hypothetical protein [Xylanimonas sp. McL0601]|uniref:hypothetical protein n=1 Tax=Xylanimonas sp. McL0601 TaxID=3414739 RepID=UPI003CF101AA